jgi:glycosyltransferase involved in cell wall biosynthesis
VRQYLDIWARRGLAVTELPNAAGTYPPRGRALRPLWGGANLLSSALNVLRGHDVDVTLLQREFLSTTVTLEGWTHAPRILDVDDAIWVGPRGAFADRLARLCELVICGNAYLEEHFARLGVATAIVPTAVDAGRFAPAPEPPPEDRLDIGWLGLGSGLPYVEARAAAFARALAALPRARLRIMSDRRPQLAGVPPDRWTFDPWSAETEAAFARSLDIGVMPLADTPFERGKCSYKMLLYMASGVPVVVSPVGMNRDVLAMGDVGLGAVDDGDWVEALVALGRDREWRQRCGAAGRAVVLAHFERGFVGERLADHFLRIGARRPS